MKQTKIITHHGQAHRDEFLACCVLMAENKNVVIHRREPTAGELDSDSVYVIDTGGYHNPDLRNFDHHQFERHADATCAFSLVLKDLGLYDDAVDIFPWVRPTEVLDSKGPFVLAKQLGITPDDLYSMISPIETQSLQMFQRYDSISNIDSIYHVMEFIGQGLIGYIKQIIARFQTLENGRFKMIGTIRVFDASFIDKLDNPTLGLELFCKKHYPNVDVTITQDDRGDGYSLFRRNDSKLIDFSLVENHPDVHFAHKSGFIAKTKSWDDNVSEIIKLATIQSNSPVWPECA